MKGISVPAGAVTFDSPLFFLTVKSHSSLVFTSGLPRSIKELLNEPASRPNLRQERIGEGGKIIRVGEVPELIFLSFSFL